MQKLAFALIGIGILVIIGYFAKGFFTAADIPLALRIAAGAAILGVILLLASIIRERFRAAKEEEFKEVER